jgi:cellulose biosynthesis protein BcsQ
MKTVAFFNNKGGVGKTTLACNIAAHFANRLRKRVLLIDCDPQCNSTQLILGSEEIDGLYSDEPSTTNSTVLHVVKPIETGDASVNTEVSPFLGSKNRFNVDLIAGHPRMSIVEDRLSAAWQESISGEIGGLRKTNWCALLCDAIGDRYDVCFLDLGPSLGSLNRSVLLGSDFFVTPMGGDIFSIVAVRNMAFWLNDWIETYRNSVDHSERRRFPGLVTSYKLRGDVRIGTGFVGYTIQQYITKSKKGVRRPTVAFERILKDVPSEIERHLGPFFKPELTVDAVKLGDVPNLFSLIPLAQSANAPLIALSSKDGLVGSQYQQSEDYANIIGKVATTLAHNIAEDLTA